MPRTKEEKRKIIEELEERVRKQEAMVFVNFKGLKMGDFTELREGLKKSDSEMVVSKKSLINLAFKNRGLKVDVDSLKEEIAVIFGYSDPVAPAKVAHNFSQKNPNLKMVGGFTEGVMRNQEEIIQLAELPPREELLGMLVGVLQGPISGLANVLRGNLTGLVRVLSQARS